MKKKQTAKIVCLTVVFVLLLTGCGTQIPDMTDSQREAISEYAAQLLLKYDSGHTSRLVDLDELDTQPEPTKAPGPVSTKPPAGMDETADTPVIDLNGENLPTEKNIHKVLGLHENISVEFVDSSMVTQCADNMTEDLVIEPVEGKELLLCEFILMNNGSQKQSVDMLRENIQYQLVADGKVTNCMMTMLSNDLTTYLGIMEPDESRKVLVITEVDKATVDKATSLYLLIQSETGQGMIKIK